MGRQVSSNTTATDEPVDSVDELVDYVVQCRICIPNSDRWGNWSLGDKKGGSKPDAAIRFVQLTNEACTDGLEQWRVMEVRRRGSTPDARRPLPAVGRGHQSSWSVASSGRPLNG